MLGLGGVVVEARYLEHWPAQRFARELGLSETGLNRLCRRLTGLTAFELIQQRVTLEARRKLVYSAHSVSSIAAELGFKDPAYFCRFFRRRSNRKIISSAWLKPPCSRCKFSRRRRLRPCGF